MFFMPSLNSELIELRLLKALRVLRGMKQDDLAAAVGRSQTWVSFVETGRILPAPEQTRKIAQALDLDEK